MKGLFYGGNMVFQPSLVFFNNYKLLKFKAVGYLSVCGGQ